MTNNDGLKRTGSPEQLAEEMTRQIMSKRNKLLDEFFLAYAAELSFIKEDFFICDICLVEQVNPDFNKGFEQRKYWFELRPKSEV